MSISNHALSKIVHADPPHPDRYLGWDERLLLKEIALRLNLVTKLLATLLFEQRCQNVERKNKDEHRKDSTSSGADPGAGSAGGSSDGFGEPSEEATPPEETGEDS